MRFSSMLAILTIISSISLAFAGPPSDGFHGDFYNPAWYGGCYEDGLVYHVKNDKIMLLAHGDQRNFIEDLIITNLSDRFVVEGVPAINATVRNEMKKVTITYKSVETGYMPVAMVIDDNILDVAKDDARTILENGYSLQRCDSPSFVGWLLITIGWHTAFKPTNDQ